MAAEIVSAALALVGAKRPSWAEGQPGYVVDGAWREERERCARCFRPLPEGNFLYCSSVCRESYLSAQKQARRGDEIRLMRLARHAAWRATQSAITCEWCEVSFIPNKEHQKYCSRKCSGHAVGKPLNRGLRRKSDAT